MLILAAILGLLVLYALTTGVILLFAKIEKEPDGTPILDTNSWHFKLAYPIKRHEKSFVERLSKGTTRISICAYFIKLFFTLWLGWLLILAVSAAGTIAGSLFSIPFGYIAIMDWRIWSGATEVEDFFRSKKFWLPAIRRHRVWPVWLAASASYAWL